MWDEVTMEGWQFLGAVNLDFGARPSGFKSWFSYLGGV